MNLTRQIRQQRARINRPARASGFVMMRLAAIRRFFVERFDHWLELAAYDADIVRRGDAQRHTIATDPIDNDPNVAIDDQFLTNFATEY